MQKEPATQSPTENAATMTHAEGEPTDEEGWASEESGDGTSVSSSAVPGWKKRVRLSRGKVATKSTSAGVHKKGRRRSSANERGHSSSQPASDSAAMPSPVANEPEQAQDAPEDLDRRGRSTHLDRRPSGISPRSSILHRRLESLKLAQHAREASPARSIRFADEPRSGSITPHNGWFQNETSSPIGEVGDSPMDEGESAKGRVTFELSTKH